MKFSSNPFNPSRPNPRQTEKINLNFYFNTTFWIELGEKG